MVPVRVADISLFARGRGRSRALQSQYGVARASAQSDKRQVANGLGNASREVAVVAVIQTPARDTSVYQVGKIWRNKYAHASAHWRSAKGVNAQL